MARYLNDQAKVVLFLESGTYGQPLATANWPGMVQESSVIESQNVIQSRFLGQGNRNVGEFHNGPNTFEGTLSFFPQDWRMLGLALGSITTGSASAQADNYQFTMSQVFSNVRHSAFTSGTFNPWMSFTLEESSTGPVANKNSIRTFKGCVVNSYTLNLNQGEPVSVEVEFIAQTGSFTSGGTTAVTAGSNRAYLWSDAVWQVAGTTQEAVKSLSFAYNNTFEAPNYVNGSRIIKDPFPSSVESTVEVTQDLDDTTVGSLYYIYFQGGSKFNATLDINNTVNTGSHRLTVTFSGCRIIDMESPTAIEGVREITYTLVPGSVSAIAHDRLPLYTAF